MDLPLGFCPPKWTKVVITVKGFSKKGKAWHPLSTPKLLSCYGMTQHEGLHKTMDFPASTLNTFNVSFHYKGKESVVLVAQDRLNPTVSEQVKEISSFPCLLQDYLRQYPSTDQKP